jgi:(p)ppGpp synthase/HD superfamily hydrolase
MRVAATVRRDGGTVDEIAAAYLHDVLEDTPTTAADLLAAEALTRREGESYADFIDRVATDPSAARIKRADIGDNLDGTTDSLRRRYTRALARLG